MAYFSRFPKINYNGEEVVNILARVKLKDSVRDNVTIFLPYTINESERPEDVAFLYYDDPYYSWLVLLSNSIIDPYYEWPLDTNNFQRFIVKKYGSLATAQGTVKHYKHLTNNTIISTDTYALMPSGQGNYTSVSNYDYEEEQNENRRFIKLLDKQYKDLSAQNLKRILNGE